MGSSGIVFDNRIWVLGGEARNDILIQINYNDVWYSTDGINWVEATPSANWPARSRFTSTVFDNKLWIATGDNGDGQRFNDVWYTEGSGLIVASMRDNATDVNLTPELWMRLSYPVNLDSLNQPTSSCNKTTSASFPALRYWIPTISRSVLFQMGHLPSPLLINWSVLLVWRSRVTTSPFSNSTVSSPSPPARPTQVRIWVMGWLPTIQWMEMELT